MTWDILDAFSKYWEKNPPLHLIVKGLAGIETESQPFTELAAMFPGGVIR